MDLPSLTGSESDEDSFRALLRQASLYRPLDQTEEIRAIRRMRRGDPEAQSLLLQSLFPSVVWTARHFWREGISPRDLVHEGCQGALEAIRLFDEGRCVRLGTFSGHRIRKRIRDHLWAYTGVGNPKESMRRVMRKVMAEEERQLRDFSRRPTSREIADALGLPVQQVETVQGQRQPPISINDLERHSRFADFLTCGDQLWGTSVQVRNEHQVMVGVRKVLGALPEREGKAAWLIFGCDGQAPLSLRQVSNHLEYSFHELRRIHANALRQLRQVLAGLLPDEPATNRQKDGRVGSRRSPQSPWTVDISGSGD